MVFLLYIKRRAIRGGEAGKKAIKIKCIRAYKHQQEHSMPITFYKAILGSTKKNSNIEIDSHKQNKQNKTIFLLSVDLVNENQ